MEGRGKQTWREVGGGLRCREFPDNFWRSFPEFSEKISEFPEIGPDLLKFS